MGLCEATLLRIVRQTMTDLLFVPEVGFNGKHAKIPEASRRLTSRCNMQAQVIKTERDDRSGVNLLPLIWAKLSHSIRSSATVSMWDRLPASFSWKPAALVN